MVCGQTGTVSTITFYLYVDVKERAPSQRGLRRRLELIVPGTPGTPGTNATNRDGKHDGEERMAGA